MARGEEKLISSILWLEREDARETFGAPFLFMFERIESVWKIKVCDSKILKMKL